MSRQEGEHRITEQYREPLPHGSRGGFGIGQAAPWFVICFLIVLLGLVLGGWMFVHWLMNDAWKTNPIAVCIFYVVCASPFAWWVYVAVDNHMENKKDRAAHRSVLNNQAYALQLNAGRGFNTEIEGALTTIRVINPISLQQASKETNNYYGDNDDGEDEEQELLPPPRFPEPRDFAAVLESFRPTPENIFLLDTSLGPFTGPMDSIGHVALASPTGGGKTTTARMIVSQILACGGEVYMANPNFAPVKLNGNRLEDWRPIVAKLKEPPAREIDDILKLFDRFIKLVDERRKKEQLTPKRGKDVYLLIGEWPAILAQAYAIGKKEGDEVLAQLGRLLRESRQYGVHVISEFQDALVKTIGGGKGLRDNYRTAYYFGGDDTTAKALLALPNGVSVDDTGLGKMGGAMFRFQSNAAIDGRVPFFSNRALYMLLGFPHDPVHDNVVTDFDGIPDSFLPFSPQTSTERPLRPATAYIESQFCTRVDESLDDGEDTVELGELYASDFILDPPVETADTASIRRLSKDKADQFDVAYRITGNIDESLKFIGVGTRYRAHARQIIAERDLKGGNR